MQLELGKTYRTRNLQKAEVTKEIEDSASVFSFRGEIRTDEGEFLRIAYWMPNGCYLKGIQSEFDLIEEIKTTQP